MNIISNYLKVDSGPFVNDGDWGMTFDGGFTEDSGGLQSAILKLRSHRQNGSPRQEYKEGTV